MLIGSSSECGELIVVQQFMVFGRALLKSRVMHTFTLIIRSLIKNIETEFTDIDDDKPWKLINVRQAGIWLK
jgi:hypothetical protein